MRILVKLSTTLRACVADYNPRTGLPLELPDNAHGSAPNGSPNAHDAPTPRMLARRLGLPVEDIKIIMVNGCQADMDTPLADQATVAFFPAVGGG